MAKQGIHAAAHRLPHGQLYMARSSSSIRSS